jgi:tRNA(Ile)-lysidine synthase
MSRAVPPARPPERSGGCAPRPRSRTHPLPPMSDPIIAHETGSPVVAALRRTLSQHGLSEGDRVVVGLSGGLDSVVLLHALQFPLRSMGLEVIAAHFDHAMRPLSERDAQWVAGLCRAWRVKLVRGRSTAPLRSEAAARAVRYRFLEHVRVARHGSAVLTAHHLDDQAETVLLRAMRGAGLRGLRGIHARRGRVVRPLLEVARVELAEYAKHERLHWREDPTNTELTFARNRVRHLLLPELERLVPAAGRILAGMATRAAQAEVRAEVAARTALNAARIAQNPASFELALHVLRGYDPEVRARVIRRIVRRLGRALDRPGTRVAVQFINSGTSGTGIQLRGGVRVEREFDMVRIRTDVAQPAEDRPLVIAEPGTGVAQAVLGNRSYRVAWTVHARAGLSRDAPAVSNDAPTFDASALQFPLELRSWRPGDRIRLTYGTKKLKKLFAERRVGRASRTVLPVLADAEGHILWARGLARVAGLEAAAGAKAFTVEVTDVRR